MITRLGDVATYINGYAFKPSDWSNEGKPIIRIQDLTDNSYQMNRFNGRIPEKYYVKKGDVLISWSASLGVYRWTGEDAVLNQHIFKVVFDKTEVDKEFFIIQAEKILKDAQTQTHGATMKHLTKPMFDSLRFYYPPLAEQREIVMKMGAVRRSIEKRKAQLKKLDDLVKSQFIEMFGDIVRNEREWTCESVEQVAPAVPYKGQIASSDGKFWLLNLDMVEAQTGEVISKVMVDPTEIGNSTTTFDRGNVLYSKLRPYLNKVVIPTESGYATSELLPLRPNPGKLNRYYFASALRSDAFVGYIQEQVAGAKMPRVSMGVFRAFRIPCPPMLLQEQFARFVEQTDKSKFRIKQSLEKLDTLYKALLQKYFG